MMSETGGLTCARHPREETYIRCAACGAPICSRCAVQTPVGYKCKDCGTSKLVGLHTLSVLQALAVVGVGLVGGGLGGLFLGGIGFFGIWISLIYGRFLGSLELKVSGGKSGTLLDVLTGGSVVLGGIGPRAYWAYQLWHATSQMRQAGPSAIGHFSFGLFALYPLVIVIVIAGAAVSRLRMAWSYWGF